MFQALQPAPACTRSDQFKGKKAGAKVGKARQAQQRQAF
jgi:hypothetical protein